MDLLKLSLSETAEKVRKGEIKAVDVTKAYLERSKSLNKELNAYISFNEKALIAAEKVDQMVANKKDPGLLAGCPIAIKDLLCTKDLASTAGSKVLKNFIPPYSATVVERLEAQGAVILGKTNLDEFAMGSSNETSAFGSVKNPWDVTRVPGGSSGGSAAAVAAKMGLGAIATDTGGSIRQPANFCGIVGIKPTYGRVSRYGIVSYASSLDQAGPMGVTVEDTALILESISGHDPRDSTTSQKKVPQWAKNLKGDLRGVVVGKPKEYFEKEIDSEVQKIIDESFEILKSQGATIKDVTLPTAPYAISIYYLVAPSEASSNLARYDGVRYGHRAESKNIEELYMKSRAEGFGREVKRRIMLGTFALSSGYYDAYYIKACKARRLLLQDFMKAFQGCDFMLSPVTTTAAFKIGGRIKDPLAMYLNDVFTTPTNLAGLPGMSVPAGFTKEGLPVGVQLTAPHFEEQRILNAAQVIEKHTNKEKRKPNVY